MGKRMARYTSIAEMIANQVKITHARSTSIVMKTGEVYAGKVLQINSESLMFKNMRLKQQELIANEVREIIIDYKPE